MSKVFLFVEIEVQPGRTAEFIQRLHSQLQVIRGENGCESLELFQNSANENTIHVWEVWSDRGSWDAHMSNSSTLSWREIAAEYVTGEKITVMHQA